MHQFEVLMREQLKLYTQSRLSSMSEFWTISEQEFTTIGTLKHILMEQIKIKEELSLLADGRDHTSRAATSRNSSGPGGLSGLRTTAVENFQKLSSPNFAADDVDELLASFCSYFKEAVPVKQQDSKGTEQSAYSPQSKLRNRGSSPSWGDE